MRVERLTVRASCICIYLHRPAWRICSMLVGWTVEIFGKDHEDRPKTRTIVVWGDAHSLGHLNEYNECLNRHVLTMEQEQQRFGYSTWRCWFRDGGVVCMDGGGEAWLRLDMEG